MWERLSSRDESGFQRDRGWKAAPTTNNHFCRNHLSDYVSREYDDPRQRAYSPAYLPYKIKKLIQI